VVVPAFATWHSAHEQAADIVRTAPGLPAHAGLEAFAVLTRLPGPNRANPADVRAFLARAFPGRWLALSGEGMPGLLDELARLGIAGGSSYDALIAATARSVGATLVTRDLRARWTYERLGVEVEFVG
jgi:predicted nucleic acid-binding protein